MFKEEELVMVPKPNLNQENIPYLKEFSTDIYVNLFKFNLKKNLHIYQYSYDVEPSIGETDMNIREKLFNYSKNEIESVYGKFFQSGDYIFSTVKVNNPYEFIVEIYEENGIYEYSILIKPNSNSIYLSNENIENIENNQFAKQVIEILVREILAANPQLIIYKNIFVNTNYIQNIVNNGLNLQLYPGFTTSLVYTSSGCFINVTLKNKILSVNNILQYLIENNYENINNQAILRNSLRGKTFRVEYSKRNYIIDDILFNSTPINKRINKNERNMNLMEYFKETHQITIQNINQPLIVVEGEFINFIPELCYFIVDEQNINNISQYTKLNPNERMIKTNKFLDLFQDTGNRIFKRQISYRNTQKIKLPSPKEKAECYGIEVLPLNINFQAYYLLPPSILSGTNNIKISEKVFKLHKKIKMKNWICLYEEHNYDDADYFYKKLVKASRKLGINISEPEWVEMPDESLDPLDWIGTVEDYFKKKNYNFVVFLLDRNDNDLYSEIKKHSLVSKGYISQFVKIKSLNKNILSVCSSILHQINAKLNGKSCIIDFSQQISERNLMVIGVDSSVFDKKTGIGMVATISKDFTQFYNKVEFIEKENVLQFKISVFIEEATIEYFKKNNELPSGIIIYRQGVSLQQKAFLKNEVKQIDQRCKGQFNQSIFQKIKNKIPYYYILVNTKITYKFYEKRERLYDHPGAGILIVDSVTNNNFYEFYIQPQEVNEGSATPTCFHVAYGNMNSPEFIPKFTFDLCHCYANWQGPVRVPNVIKAAEKLSKMTSKNTQNTLNENFKIGQSYL